MWQVSLPALDQAFRLWTMTPMGLPNCIRGVWGGVVVPQNDDNSRFLKHATNKNKFKLKYEMNRSYFSQCFPTYDTTAPQALF